MEFGGAKILTGLSNSCTIVPLQYYYFGKQSAGTTYTSYWQLPAGLLCDGVTARCVMQLHWTTGNSCTPPGTPAQYAGSTATCGAGAAYPEEFW